MSSCGVQRKLLLSGYPVVLGHEWAGEVVELGEGVDGLEVGQRVAVEGHNYCGRCLPCKRG
jgi:D-arabinose 1-dehydrogenase-like Zn-dependent alcohol dehydrogenase